ncbi:hypothetical protein BGX26_001574 [Mortierella sp. AD094]|nr:hypothetical protein BGX26_001574 [Mortierella sp. AD094]
MAPQELSEQENKLRLAYMELFYKPFEDKYDDKWEEEPFWLAVEQFKIRSKDIGYDDPLEVMSKFGMNSFEDIRDIFKEGPPKCFREGWKSEMLEQPVDTVSVLSECEHLSGPKFIGEEKIVVLDFWAAWCKPCIRAASELSSLAEKYAGRVAVAGINNEGMFEKVEHDTEKTKAFLETNKEKFQYTVVIDNKDHAKQNVFSKCGYERIPCLIIVVNGVVKYVGGPGEGFDTVLTGVLETEYAIAKEE